MGLFISRLFFSESKPEPVMVIACNDCGISIEDDHFDFCIKATCPVLEKTAVTAPEPVPVTVPEPVTASKSITSLVPVTTPIPGFPTIQRVDVAGRVYYYTPLAPVVKQPVPVNDVIKPNSYWPAMRARNVVKAINPSVKRQSYEKNIRYLAERLSIKSLDFNKTVTPQELLNTNPLIVCRHLGISDSKVMSLISYTDYNLLRQTQDNVR